MAENKRNNYVLYEIRYTLAGREFTTTVNNSYNNSIMLEEQVNEIIQDILYDELNFSSVHSNSSLCCAIRDCIKSKIKIIGFTCIEFNVDKSVIEDERGNL